MCVCVWCLYIIQYTVLCMHIDVYEICINSNNNMYYPLRTSRLISLQIETKHDPLYSPDVHCSLTTCCLLTIHAILYFPVYYSIIILQFGEECSSSGHFNSVLVFSSINLIFKSYKNIHTHICVCVFIYMSVVLYCNNRINGIMIITVL